MTDKKEKVEQKEQQSVSTERKEARKIKCEGPVLETNGASVFRLPKEKGRLDIFPGQILTVGKEVTREEGEQLLSVTSWKFSEVK